ncbi:MAG: GNAT family N-acetyltransferase [Oscillospiraceae bacterium]
MGLLGMKTLETPRLTLRAFRNSDLDDLYEYARDPAVGPPAGWSPHSSRESSRRVLKTFIQRKETWAIVEDISGRVIGSIGLHNDYRRTNDRARNLGYALGRPWWGKGYATEAARRVLEYAFEELRLEMVTVNHYPFNVASKRVILKCGFHYDGTLRNAGKLVDGAPYDDVCYSMLRHEFHNETP